MGRVRSEYCHRNNYRKEERKRKALKEVDKWNQNYIRITSVCERMVGGSNL